VVITFRTHVPIDETMVFEPVYEPVLRLERDEKIGLLSQALAVWMYADGELAGETYGVSLPDSGEEFDGYDVADASIVYCYSTTVLPPYQGKGLSRILCAYWLGLAKRSGFRLVIGHATSDAMVAVKAFFGARVVSRHERWYGTSRVAHLYELPL
jgi:GNAT superfamily N-acetyltransferase